VQARSTRLFARPSARSHPTLASSFHLDATEANRPYVRLLTVGHVDCLIWLAGWLAGRQAEKATRGARMSVESTPPPTSSCLSGPAFVIASHFWPRNRDLGEGAAIQLSEAIYQVTRAAYLLPTKVLNRETRLGSMTEPALANTSAKCLIGPLARAPSKWHRPTPLIMPEGMFEFRIPESR